MLACWLFLYSFDAEKRGLLILACILMGVSLLGANEGGYPLAALMPFLLWFTSKEKAHIYCWGYAWLGTIGLLSIRLITFLLGTHDAYQLTAGGAKSPASVGNLTSNLLLHLQPSLNYFAFNGVQKYWGYGLSLIVVVLMLLALLRLPQWTQENLDEGLSRRQYLLCSLTAALAVLLGIGCYVNFKDLARTQFYAAPAQATLLAFLIELTASYFTARARFFFATASTAAIVFLAGTSSMDYQNTFNTDVRFEKIIHIFQQVQALAPHFKPDTLIAFVPTDEHISPLGPDYTVQCLCLLTFGLSSIQAHYADPYDYTPTFTKDGVELPKLGQVWLSYAFIPSMVDQSLFDYKQLVAFAVSPAGDVILLKKLPHFLLPESNWAKDYNPDGQILSEGEVKALPYVHFSSWMPRFHPPPDILAGDSNLILMNGWYGLQSWKGDRFRWVNNDAEVLLPYNKNNLTLQLDIETGPAIGSKAPRLKILDEDGQTIVQGPSLTGRQTLTLELPANLNGQLVKLKWILIIAGFQVTPES